LCRGKNRAYWIFWESPKEQLKEAGVFTKEIGNINSINRYLDGDDFEVRVTVDLFRTGIATKVEPSVSEENSQQNVIASLKELLAKGSHSDLSLCIGGKDFKLHKAILSARSPYFADYFHQNPEAETFNVDLNVSVQAANAFVNFIYAAESDQLDSEEDLLKIFALSDIYQIHDLKEIYECQLETRVSYENALNMFCYALKYNSTHGLKRRAFDLIIL
jgi:hypothetical protein